MSSETGKIGTIWLERQEPAVCKTAGLFLEKNPLRQIVVSLKKTIAKIISGAQSGKHCTIFAAHIVPITSSNEYAKIYLPPAASRFFSNSF